MIGGSDISFENAIRWMLLDLADDQSTFIQPLASNHQATQHYLSKSITSLNGVNKQRWTNLLNWHRIKSSTIYM